MAINKDLLNLLVCPICKSSLSFNPKTKELICRVDRLAFPIKHSVPVMLVNKARPLSQEDLPA